MPKGENSGGSLGTVFPNHPRRCRGKNKQGERCKQAASIGSLYCRFHQKGHEKSTLIRLTGDPTRRLGLVYSRVLGRKLADRVRELEPKRNDAIQLRDELLIMRAMAMDAIEHYEKVHEILEQPETKPTEEQRGRINAAASALLYEAMGRVRDMALAASKVEKEIGVDLGAVQSMMLQVVMIVDKHLVASAPLLQQAGVDPQALMDAITADVDNVKIVGRPELRQHGFDESATLDAIDSTIGDKDEPQSNSERSA